MSYAGPSRTQSVRQSTPVTARRPSGTSSARTAPDETHETDWQQVAVFGAGLALGITLGAGIAMLTAPQSGEETRADIRRFTVRKRQMLGRRSRDAWDDLRAELRGARRAFQRRRMIRESNQEAENYAG